MKKILKSIILITGLVIAAPCLYAQISVGVGITATIAPPEIPVYVQPVCPADGYIWTPGYWAYGDDGYYWVPGVWVAPPEYGLLWTPDWWGYDGDVYVFHSGYWGPHVGFYGDINYGCGYGGYGYYGGRWAGNRFEYNTAVNHVDRTFIHNTYVNNTFVRNNSRASFNGRGGVMARPTREEEMAAHQRRMGPTSNQMVHQRTAAHDRNQFASVNHGRPAVTAMNKINGRRFSQQGRIAQNVSSGRAANTGRLTANRRSHAASYQNRVGRSANGVQRNATNRVAQRKATGQQRIARANMHNQRAARQQGIARVNMHNQRAARQQGIARVNVHNQRATGQQRIARANMRNQRAARQQGIVRANMHSQRATQRSVQRANVNRQANVQRAAGRTANFERAQSRNNARMSAPQRQRAPSGGGRQMPNGGGNHRR